MKKTILLIIVIVILLHGAGISWALTIDEAKAEIERLITIEKRVHPKEAPVFLNAIDRLMVKGVSLENAFQLIDTSIKSGVRGRELAPILLVIELTTDVSDAAARVATAATLNKYTPPEVLTIVKAIKKGIEAGVDPDMVVEVVRINVERGLLIEEIQGRTKSFIEDIKTGISPQEALTKATN